MVLAQDKGYDLVVRGQDVNKTSELYNPPKPRLNGSLAFARWAGRRAGGWLGFYVYWPV